MAHLKGRDLLVMEEQQDGTYTAIAGNKSCDIDNEVEMIEISYPGIGNGRDFTTGRTTWGVMLGCLVGDNLDDLLKVGKKYRLRITIRDTDEQVGGYAYLKKCKISGSTGSLATGQFEFQGTGILG